MKLKVLTVIFAIIVVLMMFSNMAFAEPDQEDDSAAESVPTAGLDNFKPVKEYPEGHFTDVKTDKWYFESVTDAYKYGLVNGDSETTYSPDANLTIAEAITLASRIHSIYNNDGHVFEKGKQVWYKPYVDYAVSEGIIHSGDFSEKSKFKRLTFTAPWDLNWTCKDAVTSELFSPVFRDSAFVSKYGNSANAWFIILYKQPWFRSMISQKWAEIGGATGISKCLDEERALIDLYKPDLNRRVSDIMSLSLADLDWIEKRAQLVDFTHWN